jgi:hypothetical protein
MFYFQFSITGSPTGLTAWGQMLLHNFKLNRLYNCLFLFPDCLSKARFVSTVQYHQIIIQEKQKSLQRQFKCKILLFMKIKIFTLYENEKFYTLWKCKIYSRYLNQFLQKNSQNWIYHLILNMKSNTNMKKTYLTKNFFKKFLKWQTFRYIQKQLLFLAVSQR